VAAVEVGAAATVAQGRTVAGRHLTPQGQVALALAALAWEPCRQPCRLTQTILQRSQQGLANPQHCPHLSLSLSVFQPAQVFPLPGRQFLASQQLRLSRLLCH